jgi:hypothetical protein
MYIVELYAAGETLPNDCIPEFFVFRAEAEQAGHDWIGESAKNGDWAVRFTIREARED